MRTKYTAAERLVRQLNQTSRYSEVLEFREQARDVLRLGGVRGLDAWLMARLDLGLLDQPAELKRAAADLERCTDAVVSDALAKQQAKPRRSWEEQLALLNERETERRNTKQPPPWRHPMSNCKSPRRTDTAERMAKAWTRLEQQRRREQERLV